MSIKFNSVNRTPMNCMAAFMVKVTSEVCGSVQLTFASHEHITLRITHEGHTTRHSIDHTDIVADPEAAALDVLVKTSPITATIESG